VTITINSRHDLDPALAQLRDDVYDVVDGFLAAIAHLDDWHNLGYPSRTPGSDPVSPPIVLDDGDYDENGNLDPVKLLLVERLAANIGRELYLSELTRLQNDLQDLARAAERCAHRVRRNALPARVKPNEVAEKLERWCANHTRNGYPDVEAAPNDGGVRKVNGDPVCRWCYEIWRKYNVLPTLDLIELRLDLGRVPPTREADWARKMASARKTVPTARAKSTRGTAPSRFREAVDRILERGTEVQHVEDMRARFEHEHGAA
jgi:hypothetical protein